MAKPKIGQGLDRRLSLVQQQHAHEIVTRIGLDPGSFEVREVEGLEGCLVTEFRHPVARAFFRFDWMVQFRTGFYLDWWPSHTGESPTATADNWVDALAEFQRWAKAVNAELSTPDVWKLAREQRAWLGSTAADFETNTPFTPLEREQIVRHLRTIEEFTIKQFKLSEAHQEHVRDQLKYLTDAAQRVGRFDFKNLVVSAFIDIVLTIGLDDEKRQQFLALVTQLLGPVVLGVARMLQ